MTAVRETKRILVVITRRIGDVLLARPLIESIKTAWPDTTVDALVFDGTQGALATHPGVHRIHAIPERPGILQHIVFIAKLFRRYDLALSLLPGDRPTLYAWLAGRRRVGLSIDSAGYRWKQWLLDRWIAFDNLNTHTVRMNLALTALLGIPAQSASSMYWNAANERELAVACPFDTTKSAYAVLHVFPKFNYKMWHSQGWVQLAQWLADRGLKIVMTGGSDPEELAYVDALITKLPGSPLNLVGKMSLPAAACLVSRAQLYVGPDTAMTHVAAATGVPVIALFGPSNPVKWGPWPAHHAPSENPWRRCGSQQVGNVVLLQGTGACVPCHLEGCDRHVASHSDCLQQLPASRVIQAANQMLATQPR